MLTSYLLSFVIALLIHELGHLAAAWACRVPVMEFGLGWGRRVFGVRRGGIEYEVRALPLGAYVRMDIAELQRRKLSSQVLVLLAGVVVNLVAAALAAGTAFGTVNLLLAATNLLPLYQQDGWKCGMVILRAVLRRKSALVEWAFTIAGTGVSVALIAFQALRNF